MGLDLYRKIRLMKNEDLIGQYCRWPNGYRVFVIQIANSEGVLPARAIGHYIDGPDKGCFTYCYTHLVQPLGREVPVNPDHL